MVFRTCRLCPLPAPVSGTHRPGRLVSTEAPRAFTPTWDRPSELISSPSFCKWRHRSQEGEWLAQGYVTCLGGARSRVALPWGPWHCPPIASTSKAFLLLRQALWGHLQTSWQKQGWARRPRLTHGEEFRKPAHARSPRERVYAVPAAPEQLEGHTEGVVLLGEESL